AAMSMPATVPPTFAFRIFGGMKISMGCFLLKAASSCAHLLLVGIDEGCVFIGAAFGPRIFLAHAPSAARAKIICRTNVRPRNRDHREQPRVYRLHRNRLGEEFVDAGVARLDYVV